MTSAARRANSIRQKRRSALFWKVCAANTRSPCRREGIAQSLYYSWSKEFLEAGKWRLAGDTARQASSPEVKDGLARP